MVGEVTWVYGMENIAPRNLFFLLSLQDGEFSLLRIVFMELTMGWLH